MLDVLLVKKLSRAQIPLIIGKYKNGRYKELGHVARYLQTDCVKVRCDRPTRINMDGEIRTSETVEMKLAEKKIRFFYPKGLSYQNT